MQLRRIVKRVCALLVILLLLIGLELLRSTYMLEVSDYEIPLKTDVLQEGLRIVHLTDIHDSVFGSENKKLVSRVEAETPDLIFITGDLINSHKEPDTYAAQDLIRKLADIAPVYISLGNQEMSLIKDQGIDLGGEYERAGATVLDYYYVDLQMKGQNLRIGGIYGYCQPVAYAVETHRENETAFLQDFQNTDACKLLLCHMPVCWVKSYSLCDWDVDVVFSGHVHGGQVRIPFVGGLWAPDFGWYPGELSGVYTTTPEDWAKSREKLFNYAEKKKYDTSYYEEHDQYNPSFLVLSRGLGNTDWVPRFNNPPEIVVVDLVPGDGTGN